MRSVWKLAAVFVPVLLALSTGCAAGRANLETGRRSEVRDVAGRLVVLNDGAGAERELARARARRSGDAWIHFGGALLARRSLDFNLEVRELCATVAAGPSDPVSLVALRRLGELAEGSQERAEDVERGLSPLQPKLAGLFAYRARVARIAAAQTQNEYGRVMELRRENGAVLAWSLAGPFGLYRALDFLRAYPPEAGTWPASVHAPLGLPDRVTRPLPAPDGSISLDGEPSDGDVFYLSADLSVSTGGRYLASLASGMSVRAWVDGRPLFERRADLAYLPAIEHVSVELAKGAHHLLVKVSRMGGRAGLHVAFAREDGQASDVEARPTAPGTFEKVQPYAPVSPILTGRELMEALVPSAGPVLSRYLAAQDASGLDREGAKALLSEAIGLAPDSASLRLARAEALENDPTLDEAVSRAREEADLRDALARDPGEAEARVSLASLLVRTGRLDDADLVLTMLDTAEAARPDALEVRARAAKERGLFERAEALAGQAGEGSTCGAVDLGLSLSESRREVERTTELMKRRAGCGGGRERLATLLRIRGDPKGSASALLPLVKAEPWNIEPALALASAYRANRDEKGAVSVLEALLAIWPRSERLWSRLGDERELAHDDAGARQARTLALLLDGSNLGLRRALALEDGHEVLSEFAEDGDLAMKAYLAGPKTRDTSATLVLDAAAVEIHPGGSATERTHQIIHVLDQHGVEEYGEMSIPPGAEVLVLRTQKPDGRRIEPDQTASAKGTVSLTGLEPGDFVEVEWLRSERGAPEGYAADPFYFQVPNARMNRSTYVVAAPASFRLEVDAHGMPPPKIKREGERLVMRAERTSILPFLPEPGASPATEYLPFLSVGVGGGLDALQRQLSDLVADKTRPTEELASFAAAVKKAAGERASPSVLLRTAYARVEKQVLGSGGLVDDASAVLSRGRGSRLLVLKAVLDELGFNSRFALIRPFTSDPAPYRFPSFGLYGQILLRVTAGNETFWLDPSLRQNPFGALQSDALGSEALVLAEPGEPLMKTHTPERSPVEEGRTVDLRIMLAEDGSAEVSGLDTYSGALGAGVKSAVERLDPSTRRQLLESMLARSFRGLSVAEARFEGEDDPDAPLVIRWKGVARDLLRTTLTGAVIDAAPFASQLGEHFVKVASRVTPLLIPQAERTTLRMEVVPPRGLIVKRESDERLETDFGSFARTDRVNERSLIREDSLLLRRGRIAPARYAEFAGFATAVDAAEERPVVLRNSDPG